MFVFCFFFFFQAEDGIRDLTVTGVQTCALPISVVGLVRRPAGGRGDPRGRSGAGGSALHLGQQLPDGRGLQSGARRDRKSTRLNSSHSQISYAVFCLNNKNSGITLHSPCRARALATSGTRWTRE